MSNQVLDKIKDIQKELNELEVKKDLLQSQRVIASIVRLLDDSVSVDDQSLFQLFTDSDGKIRSNAHWFYEDSVMTDRKATYKVHSQNNLNLDIKLYGITKPSKRTIAWAQALTPNFEDEPFNKNFNVGIDFIVPKSADRVIVVLSNNWVIRTLELKGKLTVTFQEILARWAEIKNFDNKTELHNILWESFDIQPLNKKFYSGISERFTLLRQYLVKEKVFDEKHASLFANRLLGRVIFCWFLDKKGIINTDQKYFDSESFDNDNEYYKTKLERLFFGVLNTPIGDREFKDDITPFLNGGLFEARKNDLYNDSKISFPKNYFDDLFEFLSGYNFTTDESTSQFQQVAIDPEMLGRIFENLLAEMTEETGEQARKAKGAFYTPREIVDYMCKESLKEYLKTQLKEDENRNQRLAQLIDEPDKNFQDQARNWRRDWKPYKADILKALDELKVLDPACGSGAFPIGMLQLLVRVYERLEARFDSYKTKLGIIEKNIYGVDIEPMAVEIARLRAWLSIIVDEESDSKKIKPLPNLEFKFICANSLIDLDKNGSNTFGDDPELQEKLASIRDGYFNTESLNKKKKLRGEYEKLVTQGEGLFGESKKSRQLKTYRPFDNEAQAEFFDPQFMFGVKAFDVVIGNPPYVNIVRLRKEIRDELKKIFTITKNKVDLYAYFIEKSHQLLNERGVVAFIVPQTWKATDSFSKLREFMFNNFGVKTIVNLQMGTFDAVVRPLILIMQKSITVDNVTIVDSNFEYVSSFKSDEINSKSNYSIDTESTTDQRNLYKKIEENSKPLSDFIKFTRGIKTSNDSRFISTEATNEEYHKVYRGRNVKAYQLNWSGEYIWYRPDLMREKVGCLPHTSELFEVPEKLVTQRVNSSMQLLVAYDTEENYFLDTVNVSVFQSWDGATSFKLLLGLLNSKLINFWYSHNFRMPTIGLYELHQIPIKLGSESQKNKLINLVEKILGAEKNSDEVDGVRSEIDQIVFDIYGLDDIEVRMISEL